MVPSTIVAGMAINLLIRTFGKFASIKLDADDFTPSQSTLITVFICSLLFSLVFYLFNLENECPPDKISVSQTMNLSMFLVSILSGLGIFANSKMDDL